MLIEFSFENYRSYRDENTLSLVAAKIKESEPKIDQINVVRVSEKLELLKIAAILGANAGGKSNVVHAFRFMKRLVLDSSKDSRSNENIRVESFLLDEKTENKESYFQVIFLLEGKQYRYGFTVNKKSILTEWLYAVPTTKEAMLFQRDGDKIKTSRDYFGEGKGLEKLTRPNALFLSVVSQFNGETANKVYNWFTDVGIVSGLNDVSQQRFTNRQFIEGGMRDRMIEMITGDDVGIIDMDGERVPVSIEDLDLPAELKPLVEKSNNLTQYKILAFHKKWKVDGSITKTAFPIEQESDGTQKLFYLSGPIIDILENGKVLVIDEIEARLHPNMTINLIKTFQSELLNPRNAQLIFTTHESNILSKKILRRDQFWFAKKGQKGESILYPLSDFKLRNDKAIEKDYLAGVFGSIPILSDLEDGILG